MRKFCDRGQCSQFSPWPLSAMKSTDEMGMTMMPTMRSATARLMMNMLDTVCSRFSVLATSYLYCPLHPDTQLPDGVEHHPVTHRRHAGQQQQRQAQHQPVRLGIRSGWEYSLGFIFSLHKLSIHGCVRNLWQSWLTLCVTILINIRWRL